jgi:hypothetical protein
MEDDLSSSDSEEDPDTYFVESMMQSLVEIEGDYRMESYASLIRHAAAIIHKKYFANEKKKKDQAVYYACCRVWGERRSLQKGKHDPSTMITVEQLKKGEIGDSMAELLYFIVGKQPKRGDKPWIVQFPRGLIKCTAKYELFRSFLQHKVAPVDSASRRRSSCLEQA